jgi:uncharacterized protein YprB with RNaseH-like and TPR domain
MARSELSGRLGRIRAAQKKSGGDDHKGTGKEGGHGDRAIPVSGTEIPGWKETAPHLFEREKTVAIADYRALFSSYLPLLFPREKETLASLIQGDSSQAPGAKLIDSMAFFDLETTGLSHGAGTVAFMAGFARFCGAGKLQVTQLLISDYPGESAFLSRLACLVESERVLVSFNGKCFDAQILQTRYLMNGMRPFLHTGDYAHLDLLFPSRRLWKASLGSCRMIDIETGILGMERTDDLPGSEAPEAWFEFLKTGNAGRLLEVGDHNLADTVSLARILFALDESIDEGTGRAALIRALDLRARGEYGEAALFLESLTASGDTLASRLLAIDSEHRLGELDRALELALAIGDDGRAARIRRKLGEKGDQPQ